MFGLNIGHKVLLVWGIGTDAETLKSFVNQLKDTVGNTGQVSVENEQMLMKSQHVESSFDKVLVNIIPPIKNTPKMEIFGEIVHILKPKGQIILKTNSQVENLLSNLKLSGFVNPSENVEDSEVRVLKANKPNFEVGSSMMLSLSINNSKNNKQNNKWQIDLNDDDVHLEDPDDLLSEEDLKKPDPSTLQVCGTTGQRKACKNCVCGLKEELDAEADTQVKEQQKEFKSSCGSCFLGDAFRCASCPYLGMPAFKPGEKVKLTPDTLQD